MTSFSQSMTSADRTEREDRLAPKCLKYKIKNNGTGCRNIVGSSWGI